MLPIGMSRLILTSKPGLFVFDDDGIVRRKMGPSNWPCDGSLIVLCNGVEVRWCYEADPNAGYALFYAERDGCPYADNEGNLVEGRVEGEIVIRRRKENE